MSKKKAIIALFIMAIIFGVAFGATYFFTDIFKDNGRQDPVIGGESHTQNIYEMNRTNSMNTMKTMGEPNILVIPVSFTDYSVYSTASNREKIRKSFFVDDPSNEDSYKTSDTSWYSVAQYYYLSSGGKLKIKGTVTDWFDVGIRTDQLIDHRTTNPDYKYSGENGTWWLLNEAVKWYKNSTKSNLEEFDTDDDNYYDLVWLVYNAPDSKTDTNLASTFWAFTYWNVDNYGVSSKSNKLPYLYCFASYHMLFDGYGKLGIDAHTYIHETGHALGLNDYYSTGTTNKGTPDSFPYGGVDMMDFNIGDHCAYSKYKLGWISPKEVISKAGTFKLKSTNDTGEFFIVTPDFYGHPFDEYFVIEYITPTGINYLDYRAPYEGNGLQGYNKPGIRISHVDARGIDINRRGEQYFVEKYADIFAQTITNNATNAVYKLENGKFCQENVIMQKDYTGPFNSVLTQNYPIGKADPLFYQNESFSLIDGSKYCDLMPFNSNKMNKGTDFNFVITVKSLGDEATIQIDLK